MGKATLSVAEVAIELGIGRRAVYQAVSIGQIPSVRIGRRIVIPRTGIERLLAGKNPAEWRSDSAAALAGESEKIGS